MSIIFTGSLIAFAFQPPFHLARVYFSVDSHMCVCAWYGGAGA